MGDFHQWTEYPDRKIVGNTGLNDTLGQMNLTDTSILSKSSRMCIFSSAHGIFSRTDHMLGHRASHGKFKNTEIISSIFSGRNTVRLEIKIREKKCKKTNTWRLNKPLLNNCWISEEIKEEIKIY